MTDLRLTITAAEFADALGVCEWTIYEQNRKGMLPIPAIKVGRRLLWSRKAVADFLGADPLTGQSIQTDGLRFVDSESVAIGVR